MIPEAIGIVIAAVAQAGFQAAWTASGARRVVDTGSTPAGSSTGSTPTSSLHT